MRSQRTSIEYSNQTSEKSTELNEAFLEPRRPYQEPGMTPLFVIAMRIRRSEHEKQFELVAAVQMCTLSWATDWGELGELVILHDCRRSGCLSSPITGTRSNAASPCPSRSLLSFNFRWSTTARCVSGM